MGVIFAGVLTTRALVFGVCIRVSHFWKLVSEYFGSFGTKSFNSGHGSPFKPRLNTWEGWARFFRRFSLMNSWNISAWPSNTSTAQTGMELESLRFWSWIHFLGRPACKVPCRSILGMCARRLCQKLPSSGSFGRQARWFECQAQIGTKNR